MTLMEMDTVRDGNFVTFNVASSLPAQRLWNCSILAYGCPNHLILSEEELSELLCLYIHTCIMELVDSISKVDLDTPIEYA